MAYQPTVWTENDLISVSRMNKIEKGLEQVSKIQEENNPLYNLFGPSNEVNINFKNGGIAVYPVSEIKFTQDGIGTPSLENVRIINGWSSISLLYNGVEHTASLPETTYVGSYDWGKGELTITHKMFELAISDMNNSDDFPGWTSLGDTLVDCFPAETSKTYYDVIMNAGKIVGVNTKGRGTIYMPKSTYILSQEEWKTQYPNLTMQMVFPFLQPRTIQLTPEEFLSTNGTNVFSSNCGNTSVYIDTEFKKYLESNTVPVTRTINGKALDQDINLTASNVGARSSSWVPSPAQVGAIPADPVAAMSVLTQAEYDALTAKDATTLYLIKEEA